MKKEHVETMAALNVIAIQLTRLVKQNQVERPLTSEEMEETAMSAMEAQAKFIEAITDK